jgi:hypothetical protein
MAGDWIKIEAVTPDKPEIDLLAELLDTTFNEVLGGLVRLWIWADQQTIDGNARSVTKSAIDRHSGVTGLADAMLHQSVAWLNECEDGGFQFPKFERHNGQTAKQRALTAKRVAACKQRTGNAPTVTCALPREEKRREEKSNKTPLPPLPQKLDTPEFQRAWSLWVKHRREIKKPLTPTQAQTQLDQFTQWGVRRAVAAIQHTVAKGWQGIREPESATNGKSHQQRNSIEDYQ